MSFLIPVEPDPNYGVNVSVGESIVVTWEGQQYETICMGWRKNQPNWDIDIKTQLFLPPMRSAFPIGAVQIRITPREAQLRAQLRNRDTAATGTAKE